MTTEQRINIKFCVKLEKTAMKTWKILHKIYGDSCMSRARVFECHKQFVQGRTDMEDDPKTEKPSTSKTDANIKNVCQLVDSDYRLTVVLWMMNLELPKK